MNGERDASVKWFANLGLRGDELSLAELLPAVEMAWADGAVQPNERAMLAAYCDTLVRQVNERAGAERVRLDDALVRLEKLLSRRLSPSEREAALWALRIWTKGPAGQAIRKRIVEWSEAVAVVDGSPSVDPREAFWLTTVKRTLEVG
jgi:hypothetical protein